MTTRTPPWDQIATPATDYIVRLAGSGMGMPVFWGKDILGQPLAIVELQGDHSREYNREPVVVRGIDIDLRAGETPDTQRLVLTLQQRADADLFLGLCETLISALAPVTDSAVAVSVTLAHLRRWKTFLAGRRAGLLSPEQVRGLLAELTMLRDLYQRGMSHREAVEAWTGADRVQQDFVFRDIAVEVKSVSGRERNAVRISSEDQLEAHTSHLFLVVFRLSEMPESPDACSLNGMVQLIESELSDADAVESFQRRLAAAGYAPVQDYDIPLCVAARHATYAVAEGFPRLVRSLIPDGIARVSYDLELESIAPFQCTYESIFEVSGGSVG